jgi:hypothetical protein
MSFSRGRIIKEYHNLEFSASHYCIITKFYNTVFSLSLLQPSLGSELRLYTMFLIKKTSIIFQLGCDGVVSLQST